MSNNKKSLEKQLIHLISDILLEEIDNPQLQEATITEIQLNNDNSVATVFVDFISEPERTLGKLKGAGAFIRKELAARLDMRKVPYLEFERDTKLEKLNHIEKILEENK